MADQDPDKLVDVAVVIPVLNEQAVVQRAIAAVISALKPTQWSFKVVIVDDGSSDGTWQAIAEYGARDGRVLGVRLARNFGHDAALFAGMSSLDARAYITMDCDGQHPFAAIPEIAALWNKTSADVVNCVKRARGDESLSYKLSVRVFGAILSTALQQPLNNATEFKLISRRAARTLLSLTDFHIFYRALAPWIGMRQVQFQFDTAPSMRPGSHWRFRSLMRFALSGLVMFSDLPIKAIFFLGGSALAMCGLLTVKLIYDLLTKSVEAGYSTLLVLIMLNIGITMVALGFIGMYVRANLHQSIGRPRALVMAVCRDGKEIEQGVQII